ncbi:MAG: hypothetical protein WDZ46_05530 [Solirubrobacterales bacterium]
MQLLDDQLILSASDLNNHLACAHLTTLDLARARGELEVELERGADAELLARKGEEYEDRYLASLKAEGKEVVEIAQADGSHAALLDAARRTEEAMRAGAEVIYQATFLRDGQRGHADFLRRVERPSDLGEHSYEVADTKLARRAKPYFIVQLCFYSELLAAVQGVEPERIHVISATARSTPSASPSSPPTSATSATPSWPPSPTGCPTPTPSPSPTVRSAAGAPTATSAASPTTTSASSPTSTAASASC